jgi:O-glycosyl hydrolase
MVKFTAEQQRDMIRRVGAHFAKLGLKTKLLLGDVGDGKHGLDFIQPTLDDPQAMRYVGAISFHSWGGASPQQYAAWADIAEKHNLPLLVGEVGYDSNWQTVGNYIHSWYYALQEMRLYQDLLLYARPRGTMQWEYTGDYGLAQVEQRNGKTIITPYKRFWLIKQLAGLTPEDADVLATNSSDGQVLMTAFRGATGGKTVYTLHIANLAATRPATLAGLPAEITRLHRVQTTAGDSYKPMDPLTAKDGQVKLDLPAQSLTTLTTAEPEK